MLNSLVMVDTCERSHVMVASKPTGIFNCSALRPPGYFLSVGHREVGNLLPACDWVASKIFLETRKREIR